MPDGPLPERIRELLAQPNPAVMATVAADGRPVTVATWYLLESDGSILLGLDRGRARLNHLHRAPRMSLTALDLQNWYTHVSVQGRVTSIVDDEGLRDIDRLAMHYTGKPYADRLRPRVSARLEITRWHGWSRSTVVTE
jgi:PPOX class probable F420-dependent enzyme